VGQPVPATTSQSAVQMPGGSVQTAPPEQPGAQVPPQPSSPHSRPVQSGAQQEPVAGWHTSPASQQAPPQSRWAHSQRPTVVSHDSRGGHTPHSKEPHTGSEPHSRVPQSGTHTHTPVDSMHACPAPHPGAQVLPHPSGPQERPAQSGTHASASESASASTSTSVSTSVSTSESTSVSVSPSTSVPRLCPCRHPRPCHHRRRRPRRRRRPPPPRSGRCPDRRTRRQGGLRRGTGRCTDRRHTGPRRCHGRTPRAR